MSLLSVEALAVRYGVVPALRGVSIAVGANEAVALLGANGAGKSTLMKAIIGLLRPASGRILFDGVAIDPLRADRRARLGIGYCPEGRRTFPGLSVRENLAVACWGDARTRARRTEEMFAMFPALAARQGTLAWQLSGGQQQMLALARAMMMRPRLLLMDEPSLGLSPLLTQELFATIARLNRQEGLTILLVEQNVGLSLKIADYVYVMETGRIVSSGPPAAFGDHSDIARYYLGSGVAGLNETRGEIL